VPRDLFDYEASLAHNYLYHAAMTRDPMNVMTEDTEPISLPSWIVREVRARLPQTQFETVSAYVSFVLTQVLKEDREEHPLTIEDEEKIKDRLKALGYL